MHHRESRCSDREGATHLDALKLDTRLVQELYHCARLAVARADTPNSYGPPNSMATPSRHPIETPQRPGSRWRRVFTHMRHAATLMTQHSLTRRPI